MASAAATTNGASSSLPPTSLDGVSTKTQASSAIKYPDFKDRPKPQTAEEFIKRAKEVAGLLALDVAERDNRNEIPYKQVQLLKDAGLVTALCVAC
jgi:hypothetical protein